MGDDDAEIERRLYGLQGLVVRSLHDLDQLDARIRDARRAIETIERLIEQEKGWET